MGKRQIIQLGNEPINENELFIRRKIPQYDIGDFLIVDEGYNAVLIRDGELLNTLPAGKHPLTKKKKDTAQMEVVFMPKTTKMKMLWGTKNQFDLRDPNENLVLKVGANGEIEVQIVTPRKFFLELVGVKQKFTTEDLSERIQGKLIVELETLIAKIMKEKCLSYDFFEENKGIISKLIKPELSKIFEVEYGLKVTSFVISGVIIPETFLELLEKTRQEKRAKLQEKIKEKQLEVKASVMAEKKTQVETNIPPQKIEIETTAKKLEEEEKEEEKQALLEGDEE